MKKQRAQTETRDESGLIVVCVVDNERGREVVSESGGGSGDVAKVKMSTLEVRDSFVSARGKESSIRDGTSNEWSTD